MTFLDEIAARGVALGLGVIGTSIFLSSKAVIPTGNGPYTSLTATGGAGAQYVQNANTPFAQRPGVQVLVRASAYPVAEAKAREWYNALTLRNTTLSGTFYQDLLPTQEPFDLGLDATGRAQVAFNVMATKRPS